MVRVSPTASTRFPGRCQTRQTFINRQISLRLVEQSMRLQDALAAPASHGLKFFWMRQHLCQYCCQ